MFIYRDMTKNANLVVPRRIKRQQGMDVTPTMVKTSTRGNKKAKPTVAQERLRQMVKEKTSPKRPLSSASQLKIIENVRDVEVDRDEEFEHEEDPDFDEDPDAWRCVEDPEDVLDEEHDKPLKKKKQQQMKLNQKFKKNQKNV